MPLNGNLFGVKRVQPPALGRDDQFGFAHPGTERIPTLQLFPQPFR